jgi:hypothetical protein
MRLCTEIQIGEHQVGGAQSVAANGLYAENSETNLSLEITHTQRGVASNLLATSSGSGVHSAFNNQFETEDTTRQSPTLKDILNFDPERHADFSQLWMEIDQLRQLILGEFPVAVAGDELNPLQRTNRLFQLIRLRSLTETDLVGPVASQTLDKIFAGLERCSSNGLTDYLEIFQVENMGIHTYLGRRIADCLSEDITRSNVSNPKLLELTDLYLNSYSKINGSISAERDDEISLAREIALEYQRYVRSGTAEKDLIDLKGRLKETPYNLNITEEPFPDVQSPREWHRLSVYKPQSIPHKAPKIESASERLENAFESLNFLNTFYLETREESARMTLLNLLLMDHEDFVLFDNKCTNIYTEKTITTRTAWMTQLRKVKRVSRRVSRYYKDNFRDLDDPTDALFWDILDFRIPLLEEESPIKSYFDGREEILQILKLEDHELDLFCTEIGFTEEIKEYLLMNRDLYFLATNLSAYLHIESGKTDLLTALMSRPDFMHFDGLQTELGPLRTAGSVTDSITQSLELSDTTNLIEDAQRKSVYEAFRITQEKKKQIKEAEEMMLHAFTYMGLRDSAKIQIISLLPKDFSNFGHKRKNTLKRDMKRILGNEFSKKRTNIQIQDILKDYFEIIDDYLESEVSMNEVINLRIHSIRSNSSRLKPTITATIGDIKTGLFNERARDKAITTQRRRVLLIVMSIYSASREPGEDFLDWSKREDNNVVKAMFAGNLDLRSVIVKMFGSSTNLGLLSTPESQFYGNPEVCQWLNDSFYPELIIQSTTDPQYLISIFDEIESMYDALKLKIMEQSLLSTAEGVLTDDFDD